MFESQLPRGEPRPASGYWRNRKKFLLWVGVLAALAPFLYAGYRLLRPLPPYVDYAAQRRELALAAQNAPPGAENGWPIMIEAAREAEAALAQTVQRENDAALQATLEGRSETPHWAHAHWEYTHDPEHDGTVERRLALEALEQVRAQGLFERTALLPRCELFLPAQPPPGDTSGFVVAGECRNLASLLHARMRLALRDGNSEEAISSLHEALTIARAIASQPSVLDLLMGYSVTQLATAALREASLAEPRPPTEFLRTAIAALRDHRLPAVEHALAGERLEQREIVQSMFHGPPHPEFDQSARYKARIVWSLEALNRDADHIHAELVGFAAMSPAQRAAAGFSHDTAEALIGVTSVLRLKIPPLARTIDMRDRIEATRAATITLLAIELFRAEHRRLPASLDELVPSILPELPRDPFAEDGRVIYKLVSPDGIADAPPDPAAPDTDYILYSVGPDLTDDRGTPEPPRDIARFLSSLQDKRPEPPPPPFDLIFKSADR